MGQIIRKGVKSLSKSGDSPLKDDVTLSEGSGISLTQSGQDIEIAATGGGSGDVTAASSFGTDNSIIRADGTGKGVQSSGLTLSDENAGEYTLATEGALSIQSGSDSDDALSLVTDSRSGIAITANESTFNDANITLNATGSSASVSILNDNLATNTINERTAASGVTIDGVLIKDGLVDGKDVSTLGVGDVTAASTFSTDNSIVRANGTSKGVQSSTEAIIEDSGRVVLGDTETTDSVPTARLKVVDSDGLFSDFGMTAYDGGYGTMYLSGSRGTPASPTNSNATDIVGRLQFQNYNGGWNTPSYIQSTAAGNVNIVGNSVLANGVQVADLTSSQALLSKTLVTPTIDQINASGAPGVKMTHRTQTDNSNSISSNTTNGVFVQMGWGQVVGNGSSSVSDSVTFPTAFSTVLGVTVSTGAASTGAASSITGLTAEYANNQGINTMWSDVTTSGFTVTLGRSTGTFTATTVYYSYSWIAWGI